MSSIKQYMRRNYEAGDTSFLIGDSGYPLEPWLFTPIQNAVEGTPEARYNLQINSAQNVIERTNGVLKGRFRCLLRQRVLHYHPVKAANIYTCCVLHNMAKAAALQLQDDEIDYYDIDQENNEIGIDPDIFHVARQRRDQYIRENIV